MLPKSQNRGRTKDEQSSSNTPLLSSWIPPAFLSFHASPSLILLAVHLSKSVCTQLRTIWFWASEHLLVLCSRRAQLLMRISSGPSQLSRACVGWTLWACFLIFPRCKNVHGCFLASLATIWPPQSHPPGKQKHFLQG